MQRLIGINKINKLKLQLRKPLIRACTGELLPDFRLPNKSGFDVTSNWEYLKGDSDIPKLLMMVNKYCPTAMVSGVYSMRTNMDITVGGIELHVELKDNKIIKVTICKSFAFRSVNPFKIEFEGNDLTKVFKNEIVQKHIEYSVLTNALIKQYDVINN